MTRRLLVLSFYPNAMNAPSLTVYVAFVVPTNCGCSSRKLMSAIRRK